VIRLSCQALNKKPSKHFLPFLNYVFLQVRYQKLSLKKREGNQIQLGMLTGLFFFLCFIRRWVDYPFLCVALSCFRALRDSCHHVQLHMTSEHRHGLLLSCAVARRKGLKPSFVGREGSVPWEGRLCLRCAVTSACAVGRQAPTVPVVRRISVWGVKPCSQGRRGENSCSSFGC